MLRSWSAPMQGALALHPGLWGRRLRAHTKHVETHMVQPCQGGTSHLALPAPLHEALGAPDPSHPRGSLHHLTPVARQVSKATTLQKTAEYICKLQQERAALQDEAQRLREQIEELNGSIK